jgi:hypothetical protein
MRQSTWLIGAAAALALGALAGSAQAAPATSGATGFKSAVGETSAMEAVHWGWRRRHHRHYYYGYFAPPFPYWYAPRYRYYHGYAPGVRFYYGPRRHHYRHWRRHWW